MIKSRSAQFENTRKEARNLPRTILAASVFLGLVAVSSAAFAATRTPIPRNQASDNILLCEAAGGEIIRTPSVVACCNENSDGSTSCVGCAYDGTHCANYEVRAGNKMSLRRALMGLAPSRGNVIAPEPPKPRFKRPNLIPNGTVNITR